MVIVVLDINSQKIFFESLLGIADAAEVHIVHVGVSRHVAVGGLLTVGVVPASHVFSSLNKLLKQFFLASFEQYV